MESTSTTDISPNSYPYENDMSDDEHPGQSSVAEKRKRSSRACDQCRKTKSKCQRIPRNSSCRNCLSMNQECTFLGPSRKRGPPKGYITQLETRVHRLEALFGILLASPDSRAQTLVSDLAQDDLARDILGDVEMGPFGPVGRLKVMQSHETELLNPQGPAQGQSGRQFVSSRDRREMLIVGNEADPSLPSYNWQDSLINHLNNRQRQRSNKSLQSSQPQITAPYTFDLDPLDQISSSSNNISNDINPPHPPIPQNHSINSSVSRAPRQHLANVHTMGSLAVPPVKGAMPTLSSFGSFSLSTRRPQDAELIWQTLYDRSVPSSAEETEYDSDNPADAIGQLSLNEKQQVGYLGKTSGMHLLSKPPRSDNLHNGGIWHLPQTRFWPASLRGRPMIEEDLDIEALGIRMPSENTQEELLALYWKWVQPVLPVLDKGRFLGEYWSDREKERSLSPATNSTDAEELRRRRKIPRLLLLSMFTIAARYSNFSMEPGPPAEGTMWEAGCEYLDQAKMILNWTYDSPRPSTCQALILLAYREFGLGAISQAWIYMGMAIRMATDLGMHRAADNWQRSGRILFSDSEKSSRKRIWHACVILDRIMAFSMGRPMCVRERDYDTVLPPAEDGEELDPWPPKTQPGGSERTSHTLSTFNAMSSLSSILALVVDTIYACRSGVSFVLRHVESFKISQKLNDWYQEIPSHLQFHATYEQYNDAFGDRDGRTAITEEMIPMPHVLTLHMMYWVTMLLVHRPFIRHNNHTLTHTPIPEEEISRMSEKSFKQSAYAASQVSMLVELYRRTWDLSRASPFIGWFVLSAGVMHVATLTMRKGDQEEARLGLQRCLDALDQMKIVWPSSERAWQLLDGAKIDLSRPSEAGPSSQNLQGLPQQTYPAIIPLRSAPPKPSISPSSIASASTSNTYTQLPVYPAVSHSQGAFPSLTTAMGRPASGPAPTMSYFPGYDYWPPESLVFDPPFLSFDHQEDVKPPHSNHQQNASHSATNTSANPTPVHGVENLDYGINTLGGGGGGSLNGYSGSEASTAHHTPQRGIWEYYSQNAG